MTLYIECKDKVFIQNVCPSGSLSFHLWRMTLYIECKNMLILLYELLSVALNIYLLRRTLYIECRCARLILGTNLPNNRFLTLHEELRLISVKLLRVLFKQLGREISDVPIRVLSEH